MFQTIAWVSLALVLEGIIAHYLLSPRKLLAKGKAAKGNGRSWWCCSSGDLSTLAKLRCLACLLAVGSMVVLFVTGFAGRLLFGELMTGYTLMLHIGLAPVFVVCVGFIVVAWGHQCRLNEDDWQGLTSLMRLEKTDPADTADLGWKVTFWLVIVLVVPVSLSMVLGMFPIFGTHGQETLLCLHQYTSLALTLVVMIHIHLVIRRQCK